jgi:glycosyltransferase involved in cell wall biosynthesis
LRDIPVYKNIFGDHYLKGKDVDDFASWIKQLKDDPALYGEYAKKAFDLFEQYTEDKYTEKIKNLYLKAYEKKFQQ